MFRVRYLLLSAFLFLVILGAGVGFSYRNIGRGNLPQGDPVDVLLVLGSPTDANGRPGSEQRWRVEEAVREYRAGRAPRVLMAGGAVLNRFAEGHAMAVYARQLGVPATAVEEEPASRNTFENIEFSWKILERHGWQRVEVISSAEHLPRAALFLAHTPLRWRTHAAPTPGRSRLQNLVAYAEEALGTALIRLFGLRAVAFLHHVAVLQHSIVFGIRRLFP